MEADCWVILFSAILYAKVKNFDKLDNTYESEQRMFSVVVQNKFFTTLNFLKGKIKFKTILLLGSN